MVAVEKQNDPLTLIHLDALSALRTLEDESVQCCVTSPPYWGLRDYGLEPSVWGPLSKPWEPAQCRHEWSEQPTTKMRWGGAEGASDKQKSNGGSVGPMDELKRGAFCECGAWLGCLGLEPTPELYVQHLVEVFRELKRVLRRDGTLWLNLGDSYVATKTGDPLSSSTLQGGKRNQVACAERPSKAASNGLKTKDLVGIPWMVAFALRADGWYLRSDIIWSKPNPMPESVTDRPTRSHEYIFLLSKGQRYFYDAEAIKESCAPETLDRVSQETLNTQMGGFKQEQYEQNFPGKKHRDRRPAEILKHMGKTGVGVTTRNRRSVWTVTTKPFSDAHFATFPPDLIRPCILAGAPAGGVVLDPFAGSGTTGKVAIELGRKAILIEPKAEYVEMIKRRCQTTIGLPLAI